MNGLRNLRTVTHSIITIALQLKAYKNRRELFESFDQLKRRNRAVWCRSLNMEHIQLNQIGKAEAGAIEQFFSKTYVRMLYYRNWIVSKYYLCISSNCVVFRLLELLFLH